MEPRLIQIDERVKQISIEDPELDGLVATVAGLRTRHITLESQACRYKQKLEVTSLWRFNLMTHIKWNFIRMRCRPIQLNVNPKFRRQQTIYSDTSHFFRNWMIGSIQPTAKLNLNCLNSHPSAPWLKSWIRARYSWFILIYISHLIDYFIITVIKLTIIMAIN